MNLRMIWAKLCGICAEFSKKVSLVTMSVPSDNSLTTFGSETGGKDVRAFEVAVPPGGVVQVFIVDDTSSDLLNIVNDTSETMYRFFSGNGAKFSASSTIQTTDPGVTAHLFYTA